MAFARLAFRTLLTLLILLAVIGMLLPSSATVERSIVIDAPVAKVFPHLNGMRAFHAWSPWSSIDPDTRYQFDGPEQGVGSRMAWESGNNQVGQGSQEIVASITNERVESDLVFGDKGNGKAIFLLEPEGTATRLRWQFKTDFGWDLFGRYVGLMLDSMIGAAYDKGLKTLKATVEQTAAQT
ncbi:MAG TPA: SRPBCC family protein [Gammaproteobacteria bacterium]|nr:SRPBCC family protein [Gammaproteobacteria bacterium]HOP18046.1 SRPBCC family protein [Gammaproteobacteria bacterium]HPQ23485.1 SRPBCC family protein [Gammaproteobacteria bacterium]